MMSVTEGMMARCDEATGWGAGVVTGVGLALVAPILLPALAVGCRPLVKTLIRGYLAAAETVQEVIVDAGAHLRELVAEARAEMVAPGPTPASGATTLVETMERAAEEVVEEVAVELLEGGVEGVL